MARETREAWERRVRRWQRSGLSATEFAAREGVNPHTLSYWKWKVGQHRLPSPRERKPPASFVEVISDGSATRAAPIEVVVERYRIRVERSGDDAGLIGILEALRRHA